MVPLLFAAALAEADTTVHLVRHAERADDSSNANLSPAGQARARALVALLPAVGAIYTTDLCRTAQTAAPLAHALGLSLSVAAVTGQPGTLAACEPPVGEPGLRFDASEDYPRVLARRVLELHRGQQVLIVGHSNTLHPLLVALGAPATCAPPLELAKDGSCNLPHAGYGDLFTLTLPEGGPPRLSQGRVDAAP